MKSFSSTFENIVKQQKILVALLQKTPSNDDDTSNDEPSIIICQYLFLSILVLRQRGGGHFPHKKYYNLKIDDIRAKIARFI